MSQDLHNALNDLTDELKRHRKTYDGHDGCGSGATGDIVNPSLPSDTSHTHTDDHHDDCHDDGHSDCHDEGNDD